MDNSKYEFIYIPGYLPIPINYLYEQYKNELLFNKDNKNQESNSNSQLSTTSDGEQNIINNINNNLINKIKKEKKLNLEESIKKGIKWKNPLKKGLKIYLCNLIQILFNNVL